MSFIKTNVAGMVVYICNPRTQEAEEAGLQVQGQFGLCNRFKYSLRYGIRPYLKTNKQTSKQNCLLLPVLPDVEKVKKI
jgi:hypothetical protein